MFSLQSVQNRHAIFAACVLCSWQCWRLGSWSGTCPETTAAIHTRSPLQSMTSPGRSAAAELSDAGTFCTISNRHFTRDNDQRGVHRSSLRLRLSNRLRPACFQPVNFPFVHRNAARRTRPQPTAWGLLRLANCPGFKLRLFRRLHARLRARRTVGARIPGGSGAVVQKAHADKVML